MFKTIRNMEHFSEFVCHPCAGAMLISVSFEFSVCAIEASSTVTLLWLCKTILVIMGHLKAQ